MAIEPILAMTAAEMYASSALPARIAWMACHFSPYATGLSNLPKNLPPRALLLVDDITPPHGHDPVLITRQVTDCVEAFRCSGVLLDFQRRGSQETQALVDQLVQSLPCTAVVSEPYAGQLDCPVFLPPVPPSVPLKTHLLPWEGRDIWLELGLDGEILTLTESGCETVSLPCPDLDAVGFSDVGLHCHYSIETTEKNASFTLWRTQEDLKQLLAEAEALGVAGAVGLYQEFGKFAQYQSLPCVKGDGTAKP